MSPDPRSASALEEAVARVGDRWTLLLVNSLLDGPRRFNELLDDLDGLAPNVLSKRLRHLEHDGVIVALPYSQRPPRFDYRLTAAGSELAGALRLLAHWGAARDPIAPHYRANRRAKIVAPATWHHPARTSPVQSRT